MIWLLSIYTDQTYMPKLMKIQTPMAMATGNSTDANMLVWELEISPVAEQALMGRLSETQNCWGHDGAP